MWRPDGPFVHDAAWWQSWQGALIIGLLVLIAGLLVWLVLSPRRGPSSPALGGRDDAVDRVRMRYARGELDRAAFAQTMGDLTGVPLVAEAAPAAPATTTGEAVTPEDAEETPPDTPA